MDPRKIHCLHLWQCVSDMKNLRSDFLHCKEKIVKKAFEIAPILTYDIILKEIRNAGSFTEKVIKKLTT